MVERKQSLKNNKLMEIMVSKLVEHRDPSKDLNEVEGRPKSRSLLSKRSNLTIKKVAFDESSIEITARSPELRALKRKKRKQDSSSDSGSSSSSSRSTSNRSRRSSRKSNRPTELGQIKITQALDNGEISKVLTHDLIETVSKTMNNLNFMEFETRVRDMILEMIDKPLKKLNLQESLLKKYGDSQRRNVRRIHEVEFIMSKFQRQTTQAEQYEERFNNLQATLIETSKKHEGDIENLSVKIDGEVKDIVKNQMAELTSFKRWFSKCQHDFSELRHQQKKDYFRITTLVKENIEGQFKNIDDLHKNQIIIERSCLNYKDQLLKHADQISSLDSTQQVTNKNIERIIEDFDVKVQNLTKRIDKAEQDRMDKYYRQVSVLQDWVDKNKGKINHNSEMSNALSNFFCNENQVFIYNVITETLGRCLEGRSLNNFVKFMRSRQGQIGKKKLGMLKNSQKEKDHYSMRFLQKNQPFAPLPGAIPEDQLPPELKDVINIFKNQMEEMQMKERKRFEQQQKERRAKNSKRDQTDEASSGKSRSGSYHRSETKKHSGSLSRSIKKMNKLNTIKIGDQKMLKVFEEQRKKNNQSDSVLEKQKGKRNTLLKKTSSQPKVLEESEEQSSDFESSVENIKQFKDNASIKVTKINSLETKQPVPNLQSVSSIQMTQKSEVKTEISPKKVNIPVFDKTLAVKLHENDPDSSKQKQILDSSPKLPESVSEPFGAVQKMKSLINKNIDSATQSKESEDVLDTQLSGEVVKFQLPDKRKTVTLSVEMSEKIVEGNSAQIKIAELNQAIKKKESNSSILKNPKLTHYKTESRTSKSASQFLTGSFNSALKRTTVLAQDKTGQMSPRLSVRNRSPDQSELDSQVSSSSVDKVSSDANQSVKSQITITSHKGQITMKLQANKSRDSKYKKTQPSGTHKSGQLLDLNETPIKKPQNKKKKSKESKNKASTIEFEESSSGSSSDSFSSKSDDSGKLGKVNQAHKDWARGLMDDMREEWKEEDEAKFMLLEDKAYMFNTMQQIDIKADNLNENLENHIKKQKEMHSSLLDKFLDVDQRFKEHQVQFEENQLEALKYKNETDQRIVALEAKYNQKLQQQFQDFILKMEGELTRRNRLRIEVFAKLSDHEVFMERIQSELNNLDHNQGQITGTLKKLMYTNDIQTSLNIQNELDREWTSMFGGLYERSGHQAIQPPGMGVTTEKSVITLNKDCMSCTGNMEKKLNLFKVACLNYIPNPVVYQDKKIDRKELISLQKVISDLTKHQIESIEMLKDNVQAPQNSNRLPNNEYSPERTQQSSEAALLQEEPLLDENMTQVSREPLEINSQISQLTIQGAEKAQGLLVDLEFKDKDLQEFNILSGKQEQVYENYFKRSRGQVIDQRKNSAYKRKHIKPRESHSQLSGLKNNSLSLALNERFGMTGGLKVSSRINADIYSSHQSSMMATSQQFISIDQRQSEQPIKMHMPLPVQQIGEFSFPDMTKQSYNGISVNHGLPPTTQVQLLKQRHLQPMYSSIPKKRTNSKQNRSRGYVNQGGVFSSQEIVDIKTKRPASSMQHNDSMTTVSQTRGSQQMLAPYQRHQSLANKNQAKLEAAFNSTNYRSSKFKKTSIVIPLQSQTSIQQEPNSKNETVESEKNFNSIPHLNQDDEDSGSQRESLIKIQMPKVFDYNNEPVE